MWRRQPPTGGNEAMHVGGANGALRGGGTALTAAAQRVARCEATPAALGAHHVAAPSANRPCLTVSLSSLPQWPLASKLSTFTFTTRLTPARLAQQPLSPPFPSTDPAAHARGTHFS